MEIINKLFKSVERADGSLPDGISTSVIKVSCILIIGVVILTSVTTAGNITIDSPFYTLSQTIHQNIESGYQLAALMVLAIAAGGIMKFLGFM